MKFVVTGATGKMGSEIKRLITANKKWQWSGGWARQAIKPEKIYDSLDQLGNSFDVIIDFSSAEAFSELLAWAVKIKKPFFSGTTGLSATQKKEMAQAAKKIPVLWTANTAPGVNMVKKILRGLDLPEAFDVQVTEYHHKMKKDQPSGTAIVLQEELDKKRKGLPRPLSIRAGGIFGIHRIELVSQGEMITIEHQALGRSLFAQGAIDGALWLGKQKAGLYSMDNFLENNV